MIRTFAILSLAGLLTTGVLAAVIVAKTDEENRLRTTIGTQAEEIGRTDACAAALRLRDGFGIAASCSSSVKAVVADAAARTAERDQALTTLAQLRRDQAAALARAEARGRSHSQVIHNAQTRLDAAPRSDDGLGLCDADCLSRLGTP